MPKKIAVLTGLGNYYRQDINGLNPLPYAQENILSLATKLRGASWKVSPAIMEENANKENILATLDEKIELIQTGDSLLFYYTGHGNQNPVNGSWANALVYLITATNALGPHNSPNPSVFITRDDYTKRIRKFRDRSGSGHMITILDCCYSFGMIGDFEGQDSFHTVFASADKGYESYSQGDNSEFFLNFKQVWDTGSMQDIENNLQSQMASCKVQIATNFNQETF